MKYAILPCNGLDKSAGPLAREAALWLAAHEGGELVCPVLLGNSPDRYARRARRTAAVGHRRLRDPVRDEAGQSLGNQDRAQAPGCGRGQTEGATLGKSLTLGQDELRLAGTIAASVVEEALRTTNACGKGTADFAPPQDLH